MAIIKKSMNNDKYFKFFSMLEEKSIDDYKENDENEEVLKEQEKDGDEVINKIEENFVKFKNAAGKEKIEMYKTFWDNGQKKLKETLAFKLPGFKASYMLFDSDYVIAAFIKNNMPYIMVLKHHLNGNEKNPVFKIQNKIIFDKFMNFYNNMIKDLKEVKQYHVEKNENAKLKEKVKEQRKKLNDFYRNS